MSSKCGLKLIFTLVVFVIIVSGYAKDITGVERGHKRLNEYISHYETLNYDATQLHASHSRARRSVTKDHFVHLQFAAHGRDFRLRLKRDLNTFSNKLEIYNGQGAPLDVATDHIYEGHVIGDRNSYVFGSILDGVFEGKIVTERDAYYVENAKHYFPPNNTSGDAYENEGQDNAPQPNGAATPATKTTTASQQANIVDNSQDNENEDLSVKTASTDTAAAADVADNTNTGLDFHSIIYKDSHVEDAYKDARQGHVAGCGITEEVSMWMENIQNSAVEELPEPMSKDHENEMNNAHNANADGKTKPAAAPHPPKKYVSADDIKFPHQKYSKEANSKYDGYFYDPATGRKYSPHDEDFHEQVHARMRRASPGTGRREDNRNTCSLYIQTDPLLWRHIREGIADHDRGRKYEVDVKTREEITSLIAHHVTAVNYIYRNTKFDGRTEHRNIRFEVQRIKIDDDSSCRPSYNGPHNSFCNEHMDVSNFLNLHSLEDHSDFCLAYVFTYRDFSGGTLGLAWVASTSGASGGICEKYKTYTETVGGQYQSTKRSLNTGIITFVNYNSRVPPKVSQLTLAHEIGHNFGSPHDYPQECRPGGLNGNYIMFASATSGDRPNNSKFSPCSIRNISNVLDVLVGNTKRDCFKASEGAFCGNKIVEVGEECDCGFNDEECQDKCCYPRLINEYDLSLNSSAKGCTRRAKTQCSPSQGPCCVASSCYFVPSNHHIKCKEETECSWSSTCNGTTAECPEPKPKDDKTKCNNDTALCIRGDCSGSICLLWNMSECFLSSQSIPHVDKRKLCELACQNGNDTGTCRSTSEFAHLYGLPEGGIILRPGSPCDNFQGYCDVLNKCRAVDTDGPLVRLKKMLLNRETLITLAQWITENWYTVVLMGIGFIIVMGMFIKCCAVHTPSSNPKKRRARRVSETLRAPMNTLRRMRHQHGRGAGPRSIPPPAHESRHRNYPVDRHQGGHSLVPLPTGGPPAHHPGSRPTAVSSSRQAGRNSRSHGVPTAAVGPVVGTSGGGPSSISSSGAISRQQMPLPQPPASGQLHRSAAQTQQQVQLPHYAPKDHRNKSRASKQQKPR